MSYRLRYYKIHSEIFLLLAHSGGGHTARPHVLGVSDAAKASRKSRELGCPADIPSAATEMRVLATAPDRLGRCGQALDAHYNRCTQFLLTMYKIIVE